MSDVRVVIEQALDELAADQPEILKQLVHEAFSFERTREIWTTVTCKSCHHQAKYLVIVSSPDWRERGKVIEMLINQAKGKPKESVKHDVSISIRPVAGMTLQELEEEEKRLLEQHPGLRNPAAR